MQDAPSVYSVAEGILAVHWFCLEMVISGVEFRSAGIRFCHVCWGGLA